MPKQILNVLAGIACFAVLAATQLGLIALERAQIVGTSLPVETEELEKLMEKP